jgi:TolB-like protein
MPDVFLSYSREDQATAERFAQGFETQGLSVWWDVTLRSGEAYDQVTEEALRTAKAVVVLWSKTSVVSRWVRAEATLADRNKTLVPAMIEPCERPIMFELTQTAELAHWKGEASDPAWRGFLTDVRRFVAAKAETRAPAAPASAAAKSAPKRASIAVLPFINRSGRAEDDIFADGMVEDLTAALSLSRQMKVIAASATSAYRTGARDLRQIGRDLGVRYLLEGNVRRAGADLRVSAQLVEADEGDILWTQKFDRPLAEVASLQEDLVTEVAACLGAEVQRAEMERALRKPDDITAWEAVLRAEAGLSRHTQAGIETALAEARRAIAIEPDYDAAYAVLAIALGMLRDYRVVDDAALTQQISEVVARLRALDPSDPLVLARMATALVYLEKHQEALPIAEQAVAANPNLELPHVVLGTVMIRLRRHEEAIRELRLAERLAPVGVWYYASLSIRSSAELQAGRVEQALEAIDQSLRIRPVPAGQLHRMICLAKLGRNGEASEAMRALRNAHAELSWPAVEQHLVRGFYGGSSPERADDHLAIARTLWDATETASP